MSCIIHTHAPCPCPSQFVEHIWITNGYNMKSVELFWAGVWVWKSQLKLHGIYRTFWTPKRAISSTPSKHRPLKQARQVTKRRHGMAASVRRAQATWRTQTPNFAAHRGARRMQLSDARCMWWYCRLIIPWVQGLPWRRGGYTQLQLLTVPTPSCVEPPIRAGWMRNWDAQAPRAACLR